MVFKCSFPKYNSLKPQTRNLFSEFYVPPSSKFPIHLRMLTSPLNLCHDNSLCLI